VGKTAPRQRAVFAELAIPVGSERGLSTGPIRFVKALSAVSRAVPAEFMARGFATSTSYGYGALVR
jgi:hypothetical protein